MPDLKKKMPSISELAKADNKSGSVEPVTSGLPGIADLLSQGTAVSSIAGMDSSVNTDNPLAALDELVSKALEPLTEGEKALAMKDQSKGIESDISDAPAQKGNPFKSIHKTREDEDVSTHPVISSTMGASDKGSTPEIDALTTELEEVEKKHAELLLAEQDRADDAEIDNIYNMRGAKEREVATQAAFDKLMGQEEERGRVGIEKLQALSQTLESEVRAARTNVEEANLRTGEVAAELYDSERSVTTVSGKLDIATKGLATKGQEIERLEEGLEKAQIETTEARILLEKSDGANEKLQKNFTEASTRLRHVKDALAQAKLTSADGQSKLIQLKKKNDDLKSRLDAHGAQTARLDELEEEKVKMDTLQKRLQSENRALSEGIKQREVEIAVMALKDSLFNDFDTLLLAVDSAILKLSKASEVIRGKVYESRPTPGLIADHKDMLGRLAIAWRTGIRDLLENPKTKEALRTANINLITKSNLLSGITLPKGEIVSIEGDKNVKKMYTLEELSELILSEIATEKMRRNTTHNPGQK